ncbi:MAG: helix-turn-helix domain-containing protein [Bryobacterales bacterium]|nr:helix-turn-helix domain-containing protein [Bryobacterales bacterium]
MKRRVTDVEGEVRGEKVAVRMEATVCSRCGFVTLTDEQSATYERLSADAYREKKGLLTGGELKAARERMGMSQAAFAQYLCVGVASVKRWELGLVQDHAMDELIRVKTDVGRARRNVAELEARKDDKITVQSAVDKRSPRERVRLG